MKKAFNFRGPLGTKPRMIVATFSQRGSGMKYNLVQDGLYWWQGQFFFNTLKHSRILVWIHFDKDKCWSLNIVPRLSIIRKKVSKKFKKVVCNHLNAYEMDFIEA